MDDFERSVDDAVNTYKQMCRVCGPARAVPVAVAVVPHFADMCGGACSMDPHFPSWFVAAASCALGLALSYYLAHRITTKCNAFVRKSCHLLLNKNRTASLWLGPGQPRLSWQGG
jgi:hypothetical protein